MVTEILGFAIGDIVGIVALGVGIVGLLVTAITFYIGHTRGKKSEQLHIRDIWDDMYAQQDSILKLLKEEDNDPDYIKKIVLAINRLSDQLGYFVYLTEMGEINDPYVREYYRKKLVEIGRLVRVMSETNDKLMTILDQRISWTLYENIMY
jgi:hypothetical protein